jgi:hypothetical protein
MPAFQFPDLAAEQTAVNPTTGTKYKWKADPGKWVIEAGVSSGGGVGVTSDFNGIIIDGSAINPDTTQVNTNKTDIALLKETVQLKIDSSAIQPVITQANTNKADIALLRETVQSQSGDTGNALTLTLISGLKQAVTTAQDFQDLREKMLLKLSEIEIAAANA